MTDADYSVDFLDAVSKVLLDEGGFVDDPADPGGATKFGISQRAYPKLDIANLTIEQAKEIYWRYWWLGYGFDKIHGAVAAKCFDLGVNMGAKGAIICLQRACRAIGYALVEDGVLGPMTCDVVNHAGVAEQAALLAALKSEGAAHYRMVAAVSVYRGRDQSKFLSGWLSRAYR